MPDKCDRCGEKKRWLPGEPARPSSLYCARCDYPQDVIDELRHENKHLHDKVKALRDDARRLDWLDGADDCGYKMDITWRMHLNGCDGTMDIPLREAIDAALSQEDK